MIKVPNLDILLALPNTPDEGEQALLEETHELYQYMAGKWEKCGNTTIGVSLYEINRQAMEKAPLLSDSELERKTKELNSYIDKKHNHYYMLLCKDIGYFTLFVRGGDNSKPIMGEEVVECIKDLGAPLAIDGKDESKYEIWFKNAQGVFAAYFFPYDAGVIKCQ